MWMVQKSLESMEEGLAAPSPECLIRRDALRPGDPDLLNSPTHSSAGADRVLIVPALHVDGDTHQRYNRAITSRGGLLTELQRATAAAQVFYSDSEKRPKNPWLFKRLYDWSSRAKGRETVRLTLEALKREDLEFTRPDLSLLLESKGWRDVWPEEGAEAGEAESKRRQSVWDLLYSEASFLSRQLLAEGDILEVYLEPLKSCQVEGFLLNVEPGLLFGNLEELCQVSFNFCCRFLDLKKKGCKTFGTTDMILNLLEEISNGIGSVAVFKAYCINYKQMMEYLDSIRRTEDRFLEFEKICLMDNRSKRLRLDELLISPLHRITRLPILIREIERHTSDGGEVAALRRLLHSLDETLRSIDDSIKWLRSFERLQELESQLSWPPLLETEPKPYVPEFLRLALSRQFCEGLIAHPRRIIIHEAPLRLNELYVCLFNDMLLMTKPKKQHNSTPRSTPHTHRRSSRLEKLAVHRQPIPLDSCVFVDVSPEDITGSHLENAFVILHLTRFYQVIAAFTFQALCKEDKDTWIARLQEAGCLFEVIQLQDMLRCDPLIPPSKPVPPSSSPP